MTNALRAVWQERATDHLGSSAWAGGLALSIGVAAATRSPAPVAAAASIVLFVLALRDLAVGIVAIVASVPIQTILTTEVGQIEVTATKIAVAATASAWIVRTSLGVSRPRFTIISIAFGLHVLVLMASIKEARDISAWAGEVYRWGVSFVVFLIASESFRNLRVVKATLLAVAAGVMVTSTYGIWQVIAGAGPQTFRVGGITRAFATFGEPNPFAGYLEMSVLLLIPVALAGAAARAPRRGGLQLERRTWAFVVLASGVGTAAMVATQSRGGYLGFAGGLACAIWLTGGRVRWVSTVGIGISVAAVLATPLGGRLVERLGAGAISYGGGQVTSDNFATQERTAHWRAAVNMAKRSPVFGVGAGNFDERFRESTGVWRFRIPRGHAHSAYLQALAQAGIAGLLSYLLLIAAVVVRIRRTAIDSAAAIPRPIVIGVAAVTLAIAVHNAVEYLHVLSLGLMLSIVWAFVDGPHWTSQAVGDRQSGHPAAVE